MPANINDLFQQAMQLFSQKQIGKAEKLCLEIIKINDQAPDVYNLLGIINVEKGNLDQAIENISKAINLNQGNYFYHANLGKFYLKKGDYLKAEASLRKAINLNPELYEAEISLANCYYNLKNLYETEYHFKNALKYKPDHPQILKALAVLFEAQGRLEESEEFYQNYARTLDNDFPVIFKLETLEPVIYLTSYEIDRNRTKLSGIIKKYKKLNIAHIPEDWYTQDLEPNKMLICQGRDNKALKSEYYSVFKNCFTSHPNSPPKSPSLLKKRGELEEREPVPSPPLSRHSSLVTRHLKKIGYFISEGHEGLFSKLMMRIIMNLNAEFEQFIICSQTGYDKIIKKQMVRNDIKIVPVPVFFPEIVKTVCSLELDLIYYWEVGTDITNYFLPYFKPAPVQCTSIGWPDTTGIPEIQYFISSSLIETDNARDNYTENLVEFANLPLLPDNIVMHQDPGSLEDYGIDSSKNTYLCSQNLKKIHPDFDYIIREILNNDRNGIIIFVEHKYSQVTNMLKCRLKMICFDVFDRILFIPYLEYQNYLGLLSLVDVILDTIYFGGATTSYEAFAMNAPVITCPWTYERGRYTLGCYNLMEIYDCIAGSFDDYVEKAVITATNKLFNKKIKNRINEKKSILFNNLDVVKEYELFFNTVINK